MAEKGRPSASSGNAYHDVRVAHCLIDLLEDPLFVSVAVETDDATDDLVVRRSDGTTRYEQVKERAPGTSWTALQLVNQGILGQFIRQHKADPNGAFVLYTASDARKFREVAERARNASENHPNDEQGRQAALVEWRQRLKGLTKFVDQILTRIEKNTGQDTLTWKDLNATFSCVTVSDASGTTDQLRTRGKERLRLLVDDPIRAFETLERLARDAAINRSVLNRRDVETALSQDGSGLQRAALPLMIDAQAYAEKIEQESNAADVAKLPRLEPSFHSSPETQRQLCAMKGRLVLLGSHGSGKSRVAAELALKSIQENRRCLRVRLARWATSLRNLLIAELSLAAARQATSDDFTSQFPHAGVIILDGLDEVPYQDRLTAERQILEFGDTHPHLDILVTCRPGSGHTIAQQWNAIQLQPLTREQIESVLKSLGRAPILPESIVKLATNPLMLGLLVQQLQDDIRPSSEANLLDAYVTQIVQRQSSRYPSIDPVCGQRFAEEVAYEWLSLGRIVLGRDQMRSLAASVARTLRSQALVQMDAHEAETWLVDAGLSINIDASFMPIHRTVLDHLAGRSMDDRNPIQCASRPELREAVARYLGAQVQANDKMLSILDEVGTDLELLARGRALSSNEVVWPHEPKRFALDYLAQLRRLGDGPLVDIGVVDRPIQIDVDSDITWITESDSPSGADVVNIVEMAARPYMVESDGSNPNPVLAFSASGHHGASIDIKVPHYAAFARVKYEVESLVERRALRNEGPDIVYERLCSFAKRFLEIVTIVEGTELLGVANRSMREYTAIKLQEKFKAAVASTLEVDERCLEVSDKCIIFIPGRREIAVVEGAHMPDDSFGARLGVHGGELVRLVEQADKFEVSDLPLHPLGLLPDSVADPVLALPDGQAHLRGASLQLYVERHELGSMRGFRHLVENNFGGLKLLLRQYSSMPWRVEIAIDEKLDRGAFGPTVQSVRHSHSAIDEVFQVSKVVRGGARWSSRSSMFAFRGSAECRI